MSIVLYGASPSPFVRKVRLALAFKGLEYELVSVIPGGADVPAEFVANSPLGKVPLLFIDDIWIPDSSVILAYLDRARPAPALLRDNAADMAHALWLEEYADSKIVSVAGGHLFAELILAPNFFNRPSNMEEVELAKTVELPEIFDYLESQLQGPYLVGEMLGHADICVCSPLINMHYCDVYCDASRWPKTAAYIERVTSDPLFTSVVADEQAFLAEIKG